MKNKNTIISAFILLTALFISGSYALAQTVMDQNLSSSKLTATQLTELDLPAPGTTLNISAYSFDILSLQPKVRAVYVRDGELLDVFLPPARIGNNGRPEYTLSIPSPLTDLSYQFFRYNTDGTVIASDKYNVNRNCLPIAEYKPENYAIKARDARDKILIDARKATALEKELSVAEAAITLIEEIKQITADE